MIVFVYYNLHNKMWSIRSMESGFYKERVIAHARYVIIEDCTFCVSDVGRQNVLETGRKNVHAGVKGKLIGIKSYICREIMKDDDISYFSSPQSNFTWLLDNFLKTDHFPASYDPYKGPQFVYIKDWVSNAFPLLSGQSALLAIPGVPGSEVKLNSSHKLFVANPNP